MIRGRNRLASTPGRATALACVEAGIEAAHPRTVIRSAVTLDGECLRVAEAVYDLSDIERVVVLGGGKAAGTVALELETILGDRIDDGVIVTDDSTDTQHVRTIVGDHPLPSEQGVSGANRVLELAKEADRSTVVLAVITGGGSALLPAPADEVSLADLQEITAQLLERGASIRELNVVRKHCSSIKGGGLARAAAPASVVGLLLSDVVGDDPGVIASGPTAPDNSTFGEALAVLDKYGIDHPTIRARLDRGRGGNELETPEAGDPVFERVTNHVLATGMTALKAAKATADDRGYSTCLLSSRIRGEAREAAKTHVAIAEESLASGNPIEPPAVIVSGGETTVTVQGEGVGGPNLEFALSAAIELNRDISLASVDTDGRDGGTEAAGGLVDAATVDRPNRAWEALVDNDAYSYLESRGALIETGPTGTNVNDLRVIVIEG